MIRPSRGYVGALGLLLAMSGGAGCRDNVDQSLPLTRAGTKQRTIADRTCDNVDQSLPLTREKALEIVCAYRKAHLRRDAKLLDRLACSKKAPWRKIDRDGERGVFFPDLEEGFSEALLAVFVERAVLRPRRKKGIFNLILPETHARFTFHTAAGEACFASFDNLHEVDKKGLATSASRVADEDDPIVGRWEYLVDEDWNQVDLGSPKSIGAIEFVADGTVRYLTRSARQCREAGFGAAADACGAESRWDRIEGREDAVYFFKECMPGTNTLSGKIVDCSCACYSKFVRLRGKVLERVIPARKPVAGYPQALEVRGAWFGRR